MNPGRWDTGELEGLTFTLKQQDWWYILTISGFPSKEDAEACRNNVWSGFMWVLLDRGLAPSFDWEIQKIIYAEDPIDAAKNLSKTFGLEIEGPVHGIRDPDKPAVYSTVQQFRSLSAG